MEGWKAAGKDKDGRGEWKGVIEDCARVTADGSTAEAADVGAFEDEDESLIL